MKIFFKSLVVLIAFSLLIIGFDNKILAIPNGTTIEIYQDLSNALTSNLPNSLLIENNEVVILNDNLEKIKLFDLDESELHVYITLINQANRLFVYKNGKKINSISLNKIDIDSLIENLKKSYENGEINHLKISGFVLSSKRVLKNYLDASGNDIDKHLKEKIVTGDNLKLYYSASNIDNMGNFADPTDMISTWTNLSGSANNGTLTNFSLTSSPGTSSGQVVTSGWDGNNTFSNPSRLTFDGANDYVGPADSSPFNFNAMTPFTFEFWVNLASYPNNDYGYLFSRESGYFQPGYEIFLFSYSGTNLFVKLNGLSGGLPRGISLLYSPPPVGAWTHLTVSYDGLLKASGLKIYYNGNLQSPYVSSDTLNSSDNFNTGPVRIGATSFGRRPFKGSIGDVRIYNKALSQAEVLQNFYSEQSKYFQAPNIASLSPANSSTTNIQTDLAITFDQIISKGTGNIRIIKANTKTLVETIDVTSNRVTISGKTATINPVNNLTKDTTYYIEIDQNAFKYNGVSFPGISDTITWNFLTANDSTQPKVTTLSPENGSQTVPVASDLVLTFDKNVYPGTGSINLFNIDANPIDLVEVINVQSTLVKGSGTSMITINPSMNFLSDTSYLIAFDSTAFQDGAGTNYKTIDEWIFLTADTTPISVVSLSPADDATNVSASTNLQINFNKPVTANTGNITIKKLSDNSIVETISVTGGEVTGSGTNTITINPAMDLAPDTQYYINVASETFRDTAGNNYSGIANTFTWNFKTADTAAPVINTLSPANNFNMVNVNSDLVVVFSEPVKTNTGNITITKLTAEVIPPVETISVTGNAVTGSGTNTITINPIMNLEEGIRYYVNIDSTAFTDLSGNAFSGILDRSTWNFTTVDVTAPTITSLSPADNATKIGLNSNLDITFSEIVSPPVGGKKIINIFTSLPANHAPILIETINVTSNSVTGNGTNIITINPSMDFAENTEYFITIAQGAFADFYGNAFSGILDNATWNFKTNDIAEPIIVALSPGNNATGVDARTNIVITFSEPVNANVGNVAIKNIMGDLALETINVTSNAVTGKGTNTIIVNLSNSLASGTNYYVTIDAGAFTDLDGNDFSGILNNSTWNFTTTTSIGGGGDIPFGSSSSSSGSSGKLSSSSSSGGSSSSSSSGGLSSSSSSSGSVSFNSDGSLLSLISPITITGPEMIKPRQNKVRLTASHTNVENEIKCSVIPIGAVKILTKPKNFSFTPTVDKVDIKLRINKKAFKKAKQDSSKKNVEIKVLCDDGENSLNIELDP